MTSICSILDEAAVEIPHKPLFVFPETRWNADEVLTYGDLASRSAAAASVVGRVVRAGDRALLLFSTGAAFWEAFFGCLIRGVIAVPLKTANFNRASDALKEICRDCTPSVLMMDEKTAELLSRRSDLHPELSRLPVVIPEQWRCENSPFGYLKADEDQIAFLQYTSGSTASPKGVQVSHGNLLANMAVIRDRMGIMTYEDSAVTWLPHYHDMGLVGSYLTALYTKITSVCLPPEEFAIRPASLLHAISNHKANICGGPDFTYRLCVEKIPDEQMKGLDLSTWRVAYVGAERVRAETLSRFVEKFSPCGFRSTTFFPCYGLGEATLMATGGPANREPVIRSVSSAGLMENRILPPNSQDDCVDLVGSGQTYEQSKVVILDAGTALPAVDDVIGEVLLSGPSVTRGYFKRDDLNDEVFREISSDGQPERFLRTGDLGFLSKGELFITGRMKEIMIIRGRNLSPEDIEQRIVNAHESLIPGGSVAFSAEKNGQESVIIVGELKRSSVRMDGPETVIAAIRARISEAFGINPAEIVLVLPASIPRTSSGKPRRLAVRGQYVDGTLEYLFREDS